MKRLKNLGIVGNRTSDNFLDWTTLQSENTGVLENIKNIILGRASSNIYMWGTVTGGSYGFFRKVSIDNTAFWKNIITNYIFCTGFDVDYTETYGYAIYGASPGGVVKFDASTGGIISLISNSLIISIYTSVTYTIKTSFSSLTMYFSGCDTSFNGFLW